jgi:competence protein ComEC
MNSSPLLRWFTDRPRLTLLFLLVLFDVFLISIYLRQERHILRVAFLDIGQGDAVFIESPTGAQMLYDAGPPTGAVLRALSKEMPFYDRSIDVAVFSHPDMDHVGGFADVFDYYHVDAMLEPGASSTNGVYDEVEKRIALKNIPRILARRGMVIDLGGGVNADILYPDRDMTNMETNAASIVMRIRYGSTSVVLSGDLPQEQEDYVVSLEGSALSSSILKLGHHGSRTSSSEVWLRTIHPQVATISAGKNNRYGHPHQEVLDLLKKLNIPYLVTFQEGTIDFESDGQKIVRK